MLNELYLGRVRWDLLRRFSEQPAEDRLAGDRAISALTLLLSTQVDPARVEDEGRLPEGFTDELQDGGFFRLMLAPGLGGLGLSRLNAFRVVQAATSWSMSVAYYIAVHNGFGSGSYLDSLPAGPLKEMISARVAAGIISAGADSEPIGTANQKRATVAVPVEDGAAYLLTGEKVFIVNGPVADLMDVSATLVAPDGTRQVRLFFVDSSSPGFTVERQEFMGLFGAQIGVIRLDNVRVPAEYLMEEEDEDWRMRPIPRTGQQEESVPAAQSAGGAPPDLALLASQGRHLVIAPTSLALAKLSLLAMKEFVTHRRIDDRPLGEYDEIRQQLAETAADIFTIESVALWPILGQNRVDIEPELGPVKNLVSVTCGRVVDRAMSVLGAEGYETARSKARRGALPLPVERYFRDARALRLAGGVDFMLDKWSAQGRLMSCYYTDIESDIAPPHPADPLPLEDAALSPRCQEHLHFVTRQARALARRCRGLTRNLPKEKLFEQQRTMTIIGQVANELLSMSVVLARAAHLAEDGNSAALELADISCTKSEARLNGLLRLLDQDGPDLAAIGQEYLQGSRFGFLADGVVCDLANPSTT